MNVPARFHRFNAIAQKFPTPNGSNRHPYRSPAVKSRDLASREAVESSRKIKERIDSSRRIQLNRFKGLKIYCNAQMTNRYIKKFCQIDEASQKLLEMAIDALGSSARAYTLI